MICLELGNLGAGAGHLHLPDARTCLFDYHVFISINGSIQLFQSSEYIFEHFNQLVFCCRPQSSLQKLFEDLNLGDRNLVQIFCKTSHDAGKIAPVITRVGVHVECICSPQKSQGCQISKSIVQQNRRRPALLHGSSFIMRKQYNTKQPTRSTFYQPLLKARKVSKKRNRPLEARICTCLCLAQTHCQCPKEVGSTYSTGPTSVHSSNSDSPIISRALNGSGSSSVSMSSNSWLSLDVTNWSEFDFGFEPTLVKENETLLIKFQQKHWKVGTPWRTIDDEQDSSIEDEVLRGNSHGLVAKAWNEMVKTVQWDIGLIMTKMF
ncbi:hypothetical protein CMV_018911 [Castanea mollissima]|uniref:Uncharacterized protein n=1 Tax=Castanea mollissima TaxID=60419 RepID=A0A8J4VP74_9ROSI|nr:hypothetical protein CMV_018911 [Castanea mollissima]